MTNMTLIVKTIEELFDDEMAEWTIRDNRPNAPKQFDAEHIHKTSTNILKDCIKDAFIMHYESDVLDR